MADLDRMARRQHGLVTIEQLYGLGFTPNDAKHATRSGRLIPVRRRVYRLCGVAPTWRSAALAAVLAAGPGATLSHQSAAALWGLLDHRSLDHQLEVTTPKLRRLEGVMGHRYTLAAGEVTNRDGIPVTTVERTLLDVAQTCDCATVGRLMDDALRRRLTTIKRLIGEGERRRGPGRRMQRPFIAALRDRDPSYEPGANEWEQTMDLLWDRLGLPYAERQYPITVAGGRTYRVDRAIVEARIAVEWNGFESHGTRSSFDYDSQRRNRLVHAGWHPLDFTSRTKPDEIRTTVLAVYSERMR